MPKLPALPRPIGATVLVLLTLLLVALPASAAAAGPGEGSGVLTASPDPIVLAATTVGNQSPADSITFRYEGEGEVWINKVAIEGEDSGEFFSNGSNCNYLADGWQCEAWIGSKPSSVGAKHATVVVYFSGERPPAEFEISGAGVEPRAGDLPRRVRLRPAADQPRISLQQLPGRKRRPGRGPDRQLRDLRPRLGSLLGRLQQLLGRMAGPGPVLLGRSLVQPSRTGRLRSPAARLGQQLGLQRRRQRPGRPRGRRSRRKPGRLRSRDGWQRRHRSHHHPRQHGRPAGILLHRRRRRRQRRQLQAARRELHYRAADARLDLQR